MILQIFSMYVHRNQKITSDIMSSLLQKVIVLRSKVVHIDLLSVNGLGDIRADILEFLVKSKHCKFEPKTCEIVNVYTLTLIE